MKGLKTNMWGAETARFLVENIEEMHSYVGYGN